MKKTPAEHTARRLPAWTGWGLAVLAALVGAVGLVYYWRVFYYFDRMGALPLTALACALALAVLAAGAVLARVARLWLRGAICVFLCGALFCFAAPPLQAPDEVQHYLRAYAISEGHFDFDAARAYPADVNLLVASFPGAWVNAHTSTGTTKDDVGNDTVYSTQDYALKQYGESGRVQSVADGFAAYFEGGSAPAVSEPISFLILPFLPQALGMALARLFGLGALGALYGGRLLNLACYAALAGAAFAVCERAKRGLPVFLAVALCPLSLFMAASLSYDATLLGCCWVMASVLCAPRLSRRELGLFFCAFLWVNVGKPWISLLWLALLPLSGGFKPRVAGQKRGRGVLLLGAALAAALLLTAATSWYGTVFRFNYPAIGRQLGSAVDQMGQLRFILANPARYLAVLLGTFYENNGFVGQLGLFGSLDLPIPAVNLLSPVVLLLGAVWAVPARPELALQKKQTLGGALWAVVYAVGAMTAMYITWTPVGMVRIIGLQARYFLPPLLVLLLGLSTLLGRVLRPAHGVKDDTPARTCLAVCGAWAVIAALLLFQHYFIGPVFTIR